MEDLCFDGPGRPLLLVGLTGGIATGKTVVDRMLAECGARVIDADAVVHELLSADPETIRLVAESFGPGVRAPDGAVDRKALGRAVFGDPGARLRLNAIVHPRVRSALASRIEAIRREGTASVVVVDAALLAETGTWRDFDKVVVVVSSPENQVRRLMSRDGLPAEEARARIAAQWSTEKKLAVADYRIDNDGTLEETREHVRDLYSRLLEDLERKRTIEGTR